MSYIIDRRLNSKNKSTVNRQRFLQRYRGHIKKAVSDAINNRSITDLDRGEKISIPNKDISEPTFHHGPGGKRNTVYPGNKEFVKGDTIPKPSGGSGSGAGPGGASDSGDGIDEFVFQITQEEFLDFMFDNLELPNLAKKQLKNSDSFKYIHAGITNAGIPAKINIIRSLRSANARRIALTGSKRKKLKALQEQLELEQKKDESQKNIKLIEEIKENIYTLKQRINKTPFLDTIDLKFNLHTKQPQPTTSAVMFCLMDVSGSMNQATKDIAKRFFILLYLFLQRNYQRIDVVFIRHHTSAKEVDEEEFFYSRETGGTIVSSALHLMLDIIKDRYSPNDWNIYAAQASDGDNWSDDSPLCKDLLINKIMPLVQYFSYVEITPRQHQALWHEYEAVTESFPEYFSQQQLIEASDIYPVFHKLFQKKTTLQK